MTKSNTKSFKLQISFYNIFHLGLHFWDYGNAFLLEARRAGADVTKKNADGQQDDNSIEFRYDSYVQKIMGYERIKEFILAVRYNVLDMYSS